MYDYVLKLGDYGKSSSVEKEKEMFMEQVLKVMSDNEDKFQKNMEKIK